MRQWALAGPVDVVFRVDANSETEAVKKIMEAIHCADLGVTIGGVRITEGTVNDAPHVIESSPLYIESTPAGRAPGDPCPAGDVGGDHAITDGWARRFVRAGGPVDDDHAVIEIAYYVAQDIAGVTLARETTYTLCTDPDRPGDTGTWADVRYDRVRWSGQGMVGDSTARAACRAVRAELLTWDGNMLPGGDTHPVRTDLPDTHPEPSL